MIQTTPRSVWPPKTGSVDQCDRSVPSMVHLGPLGHSSGASIKLSYACSVISWKITALHIWPARWLCHHGQNNPRCKKHFSFHALSESIFLLHRKLHRDDLSASRSGMFSTVWVQAREEWGGGTVAPARSMGRSNLHPTTNHVAKCVLVWWKPF